MTAQNKIGNVICLDLKILDPSFIWSNRTQETIFRSRIFDYSNIIANCFENVSMAKTMLSRSRLEWQQALMRASATRDKTDNTLKQKWKDQRSHFFVEFVSCDKKIYLNFDTIKLKNFNRKTHYFMIRNSSSNSWTNQNRWMKWTLIKHGWSALAGRTF